MCAGYQGTLPDLMEIYPQVAAPTLLLWGERDRHFPVGHGRRLAAMLPAAEIQTVRGGQHWMAWHRAPEISQAIAAFLRRSA
jgi:pimeloyl-ACP methyl ester carboxylesterase